jgi:hypothetical protein
MSKWPSRRLGLLLAVLCVLPAPATARADLWKNVAIGLDYAGFNFRGQTNPLSGGAAFGVNQQFIGTPLDFGSASMVLQGPVSMEFATGGRGLSTLDLSFQTALSNANAPEPLAYSVVLDAGGQETNVFGTVYLDSDFSINGFGFYDLRLEYSSRQTIAGQGRFDNDTQTNDFDIGPIDISGNIFADLLAMIFEPLFGDNASPFDSFSGRAQLAKLMDVSDPLRTGRNLSNDSFDPVFIPSDGRPLAERFLGSDFAWPSDANIVTSDADPDVAIPEPSTLILMALGASLTVSRRLRRRFRRRP